MCVCVCMHEGHTISPKSKCVVIELNEFTNVHTILNHLEFYFLWFHMCSTMSIQWFCLFPYYLTFISISLSENMPCNQNVKQVAIKWLFHTGLYFQQKFFPFPTCMKWLFLTIEFVYLFRMDWFLCSSLRLVKGQRRQNNTTLRIEAHLHRHLSISLVGMHTRKSTWSAW